MKSSHAQVLDRLEKIEDNSSGLAQGCDLQPPFAGGDDLAPGPAAACTNDIDDSHRIHSTTTAEGIPDLQGDFLSLKDAVQKIKIPSDFLLNESKAGIRREDQGTLNILAKSARYSEVGLKLLSTLTESNITDADIKQLMTIHAAHVRFLQDEYAHLVVLGKYPKETAQVFRSLQRNTSGLNAEALHNLKLAVEVTPQSSNINSAGTSSGNYRSQRRWRGKSPILRGGVAVVTLDCIVVT